MQVMLVIVMVIMIFILVCNTPFIQGVFVWRTFCVPGTVLDPGRKAVNESDLLLALSGLIV